MRPAPDRDPLELRERLAQALPELLLAGLGCRRLGVVTAAVDRFDHDADRNAGVAGPAGFTKIGDQLRNGPGPRAEDTARALSLGDRLISNERDGDFGSDSISRCPCARHWGVARNVRSSPLALRLGSLVTQLLSEASPRLSASRAISARIFQACDRGMPNRSVSACSDRGFRPVTDAARRPALPASSALAVTVAVAGTWRHGRLLGRLDGAGARRSRSMR